MLTPDDYSHLKLLYDKFEKMNSHIKKLIELNNLDDLDIAIQEKEGLLRQIIFFEKPRINDIKENDELDKMRIKLIELEKENISLVKSLKEALLKEFSSVKKTKKIISAYEPTLNQTHSTVDIKDED